jgi:hypothetical protein
MAWPLPKAKTMEASIENTETSRSRTLLDLLPFLLSAKSRMAAAATAEAAPMITGLLHWVMVLLERESERERDGEMSVVVTELVRVLHTTGPEEQSRTKVPNGPELGFFQ